MNLTIVIPHFNGSDLLEKLISSIPSDKGIQIIVVDDQSEAAHIRAIEQLKLKYNFEFYQNEIKVLDYAEI